RDLLDEMRYALGIGEVDAAELLEMVTRAPAAALRLGGGGSGRLAAGGAADLIIVPPVAGTAAAALVSTRRADLQLVMIGGRPAVGARHLAAAFAARGVRTATIVVDGVERIADRRLAARIRSCRIDEPGVACA